eukprot:355997-Chlamydomonas_euryale.AAC.2
MDGEPLSPTPRSDDGGSGGGGGCSSGMVRRGVSFLAISTPSPPQPQQPQQQRAAEQSRQPYPQPQLHQSRSHGTMDAAPAVGDIGTLRLAANSEAQMHMRRMPSLFGSDTPSPRANGGSGADPIDPVLRETMKAAIVDAKDLRDELKAADARLRTKPTGIRPRDLMLPVRCWRGVAVTDPGGSPRNVFVLALLAVPILAIILPVFIKAGADKEILADGKLYACALSEIPRQVSAAWGSQNRRGNLPFDAITYAKSQRPKNTASRVVKEYLARHKQQCEL